MQSWLNSSFTHEPICFFNRDLPLHFFLYLSCFLISVILPFPCSYLVRYLSCSAVPLLSGRETSCAYGWRFILHSLTTSLPFRSRALSHDLQIPRSHDLEPMTIAVVVTSTDMEGCLGDVHTLYDPPSSSRSSYHGEVALTIVVEVTPLAGVDFLFYSNNLSLGSMITRYWYIQF